MLPLLSHIFVLQFSSHKQLPHRDIGNVSVCGPPFVYLTVVNLGCYAFGCFLVFGYAVKHIVGAVMVAQYSTYVVGIAVPFGILASGMKYVGNVVTKNLKSISSALP